MGPANDSMMVAMTTELEQLLNNVSQISHIPYYFKLPTVYRRFCRCGRYPGDENHNELCTQKKKE